ncbi:MAG: nucleotide exchange factor GrpE [Propionibacteriales bacterium]|nr:nucleotide exchange factor GrpE [Propionibacteriales bacterium]
MSDEFTEPTQDPQEPEDNQAPAESDELDAALAEILDAAEAEAEAEPKSEVEQLQELVAERTGDLQRLHAEYANYKKRVDRDRALSRAGGIEAVVLDLLPVLDSVEAAREHSELVGGFKLVAEELEKITAKYGLETFGEVGEPFDPQIHEALMQMPMAGDFDVPTVSAVMQRGVRLNDRVIRPARVGVADPESSD